MPITLAEAAAGAKIDVPTPRGTVAVSVPPGTSSGKKLRIKGHGVAPKGEAPGDLRALVYEELAGIEQPELTAEEEAAVTARLTDLGYL